MIIHETVIKGKLTAGLSVITLIMATVLATTTQADADSSDVANALPAQIPEIVTGGSWKNGNIGGVYRAVVVLSKADTAKSDLLSKASDGKPMDNNSDKRPARKAEVFIQWIANDGSKNSKIVKTVSVKEFNEKQLRNAFLAMDTLKDNEMTLLVTSYDEEKDKDVSISVKATAPGKYVPAK